MERNITTIETAYRDLFDIQWIPKQLGQTDPLTIGHTLPSLFVLGFGLTLATFVFILELCKQGKKKSKDQNFVSHGEHSSRPRALSKVVVMKTMKDQLNIGKLISGKNNLTHYGQLMITSQILSPQRTLN